MAQAKAKAQSSAQSMINQAVSRLSGQAKIEIQTAEREIKAKVTNEAQAQLVENQQKMQTAAMSQISEDRKKFDAAYNSTVTQANEEIMIERARVETLKEELQAMKLQEIGSRKYEQGIFQELQLRLREQIKQHFLPIKNSGKIRS